MDPRYLIISPEDETGGRQRRAFSWLLWIAGLVLVGGALLVLGMYWQLAVVLGVAAAVLLVTWLLGKGQS